MQNIRSHGKIILGKHLRQEWQPPRLCNTGSPEYIRKEVAPMTAYEIISIFIGILALLMSFGSLIIAIIAFLDKRNKRKQSPAAAPAAHCIQIKSPPCLPTRMGDVHKDN